MKLFLIPMALILLSTQLSLAEETGKTSSESQQNSKSWTGHTMTSGSKLEYPGNSILGESGAESDMEPDYGEHEESDEEGHAPQ